MPWKLYTLDHLSGGICVLNKTENVNLNVYIMITRIEESKTLTKHMLCDCKCKFDDKKYNSNQKWNKDLHWCECKKPIKHHVCRKRLCLES